MRLALVAVVLLGCGDKHPAVVDAPLPCGGGCDAAIPPDGPGLDGPLVDGGNPLTPDTLAGTGLCVDAACTTFTADVHSYTPRWALWADGATKRRAIYLPPGTQIDTSDMNYWKFPVGTKFWKEFTRDGVRVETRYIVKLADEATPAPAVTWFYVSYEWNATQDATVAVTTGAMNVNGTQHDIPSRQQCKQCHEGVKGLDRNRGRVLGFSAVQLDFDGAYDLEDLIGANLLTNPPTGGTGGVPHARFPLPGTQVDQDFYGYVHANCGHCHNPTSAVFLGITTMVLRFDVDHLGTVADMPQFMSTVNVPAMVPYTESAITYTTVIVPHDPTNSAMFGRTNSMLPSRHMPQIGSEIVDPDGQAKLTAWINSLQ
jgi:hypothetical protein